MEEQRKAGDRSSTPKESTLPLELSLLLLHHHLHLPLRFRFLGWSVRSRGRRQTGRAHWNGLVFSEDYITSQLPGSSLSQPGTLLLYPSLPQQQRSLPPASYLAFSLLSLQHAEQRANNKAFSAGCGQKETEWNGYFYWHFFVSMAIRNKIEKGGRISNRIKLCTVVKGLQTLLRNWWSSFLLSFSSCLHLMHFYWIALTTFA